jgi:hypothetical protein
MTLTRSRAVAAGLGLMLFGVLAGCGSTTKRASWGSPASTSPSADPSPSVSPSPSASAAAAQPAAASVDLSLRLVKVSRLPSCTILMYRSPDQITGFPYLGIAFKVDGLPTPEGGARVSVTSSTADTLDEVTRFNADGTLSNGLGLRLDQAPNVTYYAYPADLRQFLNKTVPITITVDPDNEVKETNEKNNVLKLRLTARGVQGPPELTKGYPSGARNRCVKAS